MSFLGMNPEIEKLMENERLKKEEIEEKKKETEVNDEEMASAQDRLNEIVRKKFSTKRKYDNNPKTMKEQQELIGKGVDLIKRMRKENDNKNFKKMKKPVD